MQTRQRSSKSLNSIASNNFDLDYDIFSTQKYILCTIYEGEALFSWLDSFPWESNQDLLQVFLTSTSSLKSLLT